MRRETQSQTAAREPVRDPHGVSRTLAAFLRTALVMALAPAFALGIAVWPSVAAEPAPFPFEGNVLLVTESASIQTLRPDGSRLTVASGVRGDSPRLSPDGRWLVGTRSSQLWLEPFGGDDSVARRVVKWGRGAAWSPNGHRLAFLRGRRSELWSVGVDGRRARKLLVTPTRPTWLDWSPDGRRIAYSDEDGRLWTTGVAGSPLRRLGPPGLTGFGPLWSPDGAWVAFADEHGALRALHVQTGRVRVLAHEIDGFAWSPDGRFLAVSHTVVFECEEDPLEGCALGEVWIVRLRNGEARRVLAADSLGTVFDWRGAGQLRPS